MLCIEVVNVSEKHKPIEMLTAQKVQGLPWTSDSIQLVKEVVLACYNTYL
jgi:hypothetical protein